jgi:hypothetical protein
MQTVAGTANLYLKQDAGLTTNWQPFITNISLAALEIEMQIRDWHEDAPYRFTTPNIIAYKGSSLVSAFAGTAAYDNVAKTINFGATPTTAKVTSVQMLDAAEFLNVSTVLTDIGSVDLLVYWKAGSVDTNAIYEVSRSGDNVTGWQVITMQNAGTSTEAYYGTLNFTTEPSNQDFANNLATTSTTSFNLSSPITKVAQKFTIASGAPWVIRSFTFKNNAPTGTPVGNLKFSLVRDSAGSPSSTSTDFLNQTSLVAASTFTAGNHTVTISDTLLAPGTYWLVIEGDSTYQAASGANYVTFAGVTTGGTNVATFNATWTVLASQNLNWSLSGRQLDLRVRITSSLANVKLDAWSVSYGLQQVGSVSAVRKTQRFTFNSVTDNLSTFAITAFTPDPDLLTCYYVQGGQSFKVPSFDLQGTSAVFPANSFNNGGVSTTITLIFDQNNGGSFDNSDANANLLAQNHLGSTSGTYDRSVAGRGIYLRRPDGTLRELALDNSDNIAIISTP